MILEAPDLPAEATHARKITHMSEKSNSTAKTRVLLLKFWALPAEGPPRCPPPHRGSSVPPPRHQRRPVPRTAAGAGSPPKEPPQRAAATAATASPRAAINSVCSARGATAHLAGQVGFTIACSRGNLI